MYVTENVKLMCVHKAEKVSPPQLRDLHKQPQLLVFGRGLGGCAVLLGFLPVRQGVEAKEGGMAVSRPQGLVLTVHLSIVPHLKKVQQQLVRLSCFKIIVNTSEETT